jgi:hypothetical protein
MNGSPSGTSHVHGCGPYYSLSKVMGKRERDRQPSMGAMLSTSAVRRWLPGIESIL